MSTYTHACTKAGTQADMRRYAHTRRVQRGTRSMYKTVHQYLDLFMHTFLDILHRNSFFLILFSIPLA